MRIKMIMMMVVMVRNTGSDQNNDNNKNVNTNNDKDTNQRPIKKTIMLISCLSEKGGLDSKGCVWSVELNTGKLGRLQINIEHTNIVKAISNREQVMMKESMDKSASRQGSSSQYQRRFVYSLILK